MANGKPSTKRPRGPSGKAKASKALAIADSSTRSTRPRRLKAECVVAEGDMLSSFVTKLSMELLGVPYEKQLDILKERVSQLPEDIGRTAFGLVLIGVTIAKAEVDAHRPPSVQMMTVKANAVSMFNSGDTAMSEKTYTNTGIANVVGEVGGDAIVEAPMIQNKGTESTQVNTFAPEHADSIESLAQALSATKVDGVSTKERSVGVGHLAEVAERVKAGEPAEAAVKDWGAWLKSLGTRSAAVLAVLASVVGIAEPIAKALGVIP